MKRVYIYLTLSLLILASCEKEVESITTTFVSSDYKGLAFSISSAETKGSSEKSEIDNSSDEKSDNGLTLSLSESYSSSIGRICMDTKSAPVESVETFRDSIKYVKVWGWNNGNALEKISNPHILKQRGLYYYPVDESDKYMDVVISDVEWGTPKFYAIAPADPTGTVKITSQTASAFNFNYTLPAPDPTKNCDAQAQRDLLTGVFSGDISNLTNNIAPLSFDHPLAAICFKLGTVASDTKIVSITLKDVVPQGTCSVDVTSGALTWSFTDAEKTATATYTQIFNQSYTPDSPQGTIINDEGMTKTFFAIPFSYTYKSTASIDITFFREGEETVASFPLREKKFEAGKTYTYTISSMHEPWIDFSNTDHAGGRGSIKDITYEIDEFINFNYPQTSGQYEKFFVPIKGLKVGRWYQLNFTEILKSSSSQYWNGPDGAGIYACTVRETPETSFARGRMITYYDVPDEQTFDKFVWVGYEGSNKYTELWQENNTLTFRATATTMYWVWDTSKCHDEAANMYFNFINNGFKRITVPTVPAVDYLNSDHYGLCHKYTGSRSDGYSTFKVTANYGTSTEKGDLEFHIYPNDDVGKHGKLNIPLINLTPGNRYRISFKYKFGKVGLITSRYFGFYVGSTKNTNGSSATDHSSDDFQDMSGNATVDQEYEISYEFDATESTMYWVWDMGRMKSGVRQILYFSDTTIEEVS